MVLVFVYGTLKRGFPTHEPWMEGARFTAEATTVQRYPLVIAGRWRSVQMRSEPGEGHRVSGEVFEVSEAQLLTIDRLERVGAEDGYDRSEIDVVCEADGTHCRVWSYLKPRTRIADVIAELPGSYDLDPLYVHPSRRREAPVVPAERP